MQADKIFADLVRPHLKALYRLAYRLTGNVHDAEDLFQDLLLKVYARLDDLCRVEKRRSWLARVLYTLFIDTKRRAARSPLQLAVDNTNGEVVQPLEQLPDTMGGGEPEADAIRDAEQRRLQQALERLTDEQRTILILADVEGFTLGELETILDSPRGTVKSRLHRARARLREILQPHD
jgi:RNA polymerase sigma-70 factor (ECF subfamily)